jgi:hypothetical protein
MVTLESLNRKNKQGSTIYCPWRDRIVPDLPEEQVRIRLLTHLVETLGYPKSNIAIERDLESLIPLSEINCPLPPRRVDIICYAKGIGGSQEMLPLLLIECKAVDLTRKMQDQVVGYNHFVKAPFVALVNHKEARIGWYDATEKRYLFTIALPSYHRLLALTNK